jgi:Flp pilus assembly protein TadD
VIRFWTIALGTAVVFAVVALLAQNLRQQWATERQLADLQKQIARNASQPAAAPATPTPVAPVGPIAFVAPAVTPGTYVEKQDNILKIMKVGWALIDRRSPEPARQAAAVFQEGLDKVDATSPDLYNGLGRALLIAGQPREAIAAWRKGLTYAPRFADLQSGIGWAYWHLGDPYDAKRAWEAAVALDPKCVDAWSALVWIDMATGNKPRAVEGFQALIAFDGTHAPWVTGLSMARAGNRSLPEIAHFFPLPALDAFDHAPTADPATIAAPAS